MGFPLYDAATSALREVGFFFERYIPGCRGFFHGHERVCVIDQSLRIGQIHFCRFALCIDHFKQSGAPSLVCVQPRFKNTVCVSQSPSRNTFNLLALA